MLAGETEVLALTTTTPPGLELKSLDNGDNIGPLCPEMFGHKFGLLGATADFDKVLTTLNFMYVVMRFNVSKTK